MRARRRYSRADFARFFSAKGVPEEIAEGVWNCMVEAADVEGFKPRPEDDLQKVLGLVDQDLDEKILQPLLQRFDCHVPTQDDVGKIEPVKTVADVVEFIAEMKKRGCAR